ncbi:MAG: ferredoxin [Acidobacteriota bacterium]
MSDDHDLKPVYLNLVPCHGCGACAEVAPEIFEMDPLTERPIQLAEEAPAEIIRQVIAYCPNECISTDEE